MALSVDEANTVSKKGYDKVLTQQVYEDSALFTKLKKLNQISQSGGTKITWPIRYAELSDADAVGARQRVEFSEVETRTQAVLDWKYYICQSMISWDERVQNTGENQIVDLIADKTTELKEDMDKRFATDLYTTNPNGNGFSSLATIVDSADTYAGIAVADCTPWAAIEDGATTTLVLYGTNSLSYQIDQATFGKYSPDFHVTTLNLARKFASLIEPQKRYQDDDLASAGFRNVTFEGVPVVGDEHCPANTWYGLTLKKNFYLVYHPKWNFKLKPWAEGDQMGYPNALFRTYSWTGNLKCKIRKCNFKFTALDPSL